MWFSSPIPTTFGVASRNSDQYKGRYNAKTVGSVSGYHSKIRYRYDLVAVGSTYSRSQWQHTKTTRRKSPGKNLTRDVMVPEEERSATSADHF